MIAMVTIHNYHKSWNLDNFMGIFITNIFLFDFLIVLKKYIMAKIFWFWCKCKKSIVVLYFYINQHIRLFEQVCVTVNYFPTIILCDFKS